MPDAPTRRTRLGAAAGLVGATAAFALIVGAGPVPSVFQLAGANEEVSGNCDEAEHAGDPGCTGSPTTDVTAADRSTTTSTIDDGTTSTTAAPATRDGAADVRAIDAAGAGAVLVAVEGGRLRLVATSPAAGWQVEVEESAGREIEVDFRSGSRRVQVNVELEDGQVRERVRVRDDATGTDIRRDDDGTVDDGRGDRTDDDREHGERDEDRGDDDADDRDNDDNSGHGGGDDDGSDDDDNSGRGGGDD